MTTQSVTVTGVGVSVALLLDTNNANGKVGVFLDMGAVCTGTVEITPDDPAGAAPTWYPTGVAVLTGATTDVAAELPIPARAIRLNQTVGAPASTLKIVTAGLI